MDIIRAVQNLIEFTNDEGQVEENACARKDFQTTKKSSDQKENNRKGGYMELEWKKALEREKMRLKNLATENPTALKTECHSKFSYNHLAKNLMTVLHFFLNSRSLVNKQNDLRVKALILTGETI